MRTLTKMLLVSGALVGLTGCFDFSLGLEGDHTRGERGRSEWSISDGLCPGLAGDCALDVPLALGASTTVEVRAPGRALADLAVRGVGGVEASGFEIHSDDDDGDGEPDYEPYAEIAVDAVAAGEATLVLEDAVSGEEIDRVGLTVRVADRLECGSFPDGAAVGWEMSTLDESTSLVLPIAPVGEAVELGCRAVDADGEPMLTVRAIRWEVVEGSEQVGLLEDWLSESLVTDVVHGARIHAHARSPGRAVVRASLGAASADLAIVVPE